MGQTVSNADQRKFKTAIVGLDAAGKTTIVYKLKRKQDEITCEIPTIGISIEKIDLGSLSTFSLDIGGRDKIRPLWRFLFEDVEALIFVIDSNDRCRFAEVKWELEKLLETEQLGNAKVLFLLNKQDLPNAAPVSEMVDFFKLTEMRHEWLVQPCCATTGEGLHEGIDALLELLNK